MAAMRFARGDLDGFFGLFIDNLLQLMLIDVLCRTICGLPAELVTGRILPGAAVSLLVGNLFYARQARRLMAATGRADVTALPYGINTVSLLAYVFLIMGPVYNETKDPVLTWRMGLFACFLSAVMEIAGAFVGEWLRRRTPRAALLSALGGVAITFISMGFVFQIFAAPAVAVVPLMIILVTYAGRVRLPFGVPGGLAAIAVGTAAAWALRAAGLSPLPAAAAPAGGLGFHPPIPALGDMLALAADPRGWKYMAVVFPMGLFNIIGSLQNLESARAAGDAYDTRSSLLANGLGSLAAAAFGSAFPTTIYIGHPAWKAMGARAAYSTWNGAAVTLLCLVGGMGWVLRVVPIEVTLGILLWIGVIILAQCFQEVPKAHALAVAVGLLPALAAWGLMLVETSLRTAGSSLFAAAPLFGESLHVRGVIALSQGFLLSSMTLAALMVHIIERDFLKAAAWAAVSAALAAFGLIHAFDLTPAGVQNRFAFPAAGSFAAAYLVVGALLAGLHAWGAHKHVPAGGH